MQTHTFATLEIAMSNIISILMVTVVAYIIHLIIYRQLSKYLNGFIHVLYLNLHN